MVTKDKVTEIFCIIDEFDKNLDGELKKNLRYLTRMVMENVTEIVKESFPKAKLWRFSYAIISVPIAILRSETSAKPSFIEKFPFSCV